MRHTTLLVLLLVGCQQAPAPQPAPQPAEAQVPVEADPRHVITRFPVDMRRLLAAPYRQDRLPLRVFADLANTNHAEGPRKWYLYAWDRAPMSVICPCDGTARVRRSGRSSPSTIDDAAVVTDVQLHIQARHRIRVIFMHLAIDASLLARIEQADRPLRLRAGQPIGWIHNPPTNALDVGVEDYDGIDEQRDHAWLRARANPLDYCTPDLRRRLLATYEPLRQQMIRWGNEPWSDLEDSRRQLQPEGLLWGVWHHDDYRDPLSTAGAAWSVINIAPRPWLHESYRKTLGAQPDTHALWTENRARPAPDGVRAPYPGGPMGLARLTILAGDARAGRGTLTERHPRDASKPRVLHVRWVVDRDQLRLRFAATARSLDQARSVEFGRRR